MIHHQRRRDLPVAPAPEASSPSGPDRAGATATGPEAAAVPPVVPHQERRPARDAYDLYAQIYAIRTEGHTEGRTDGRTESGG